jgi:DNA polymerase-3 subunit chi
MPTITFHHGATDKLHTACLLVQAQVKEGRRVLVHVPNAALAARFDHDLWSFASLSFVAHCRAASPLAAHTPVIIAGNAEVAGCDDVLLNLGQEVPANFQRFRDVLEVVGTAEEDAAPARQRFRHYKECGFPPQSVRVEA